MKLLIVRHGETAANVQMHIAGSSETPITDHGRRQAELLGKRLENEKFSAVFSSDLSRAHETAKIVASFHPYVNVVTDPRLRERSWGIFEGRPLGEYHQALTEHTGEQWDFLPPGGETLVTLQGRAEAFLSQVSEWDPDGTYMIVGHHSINKALIHITLERPWADWPTLAQGNTCLNIIERSNRGWKPVLLNCTRHLEND